MVLSWLSTRTLSSLVQMSLWKGEGSRSPRGRCGLFFNQLLQTHFMSASKLHGTDWHRHMLSVSFIDCVLEVEGKWPPTFVSGSSLVSQILNRLCSEVSCERRTCQHLDGNNRIHICVMVSSFWVLSRSPAVNSSLQVQAKGMWQV